MSRPELHAHITRRELFDYEQLHNIATGAFNYSDIDETCRDCSKTKNNFSPFHLQLQIQYLHIYPIICHSTRVKAHNNCEATDILFFLSFLVPSKFYCL